jgi:hypothetical protein
VLSHRLDHPYGDDDDDDDDDGYGDADGDYLRRLLLDLLVLVRQIAIQKCGPEFDHDLCWNCEDYENEIGTVPWRITILECALLDRGDLSRIV